MSGSAQGSFSTSKSKQKSQSESGVSGADRAFATQQAFSQLFGLQPIVADFINQVPQLDLAQNGLTVGQDRLAGDLIGASSRDLFSKLSAGGAVRGQVNPQNTSNIIGNATQRAVESNLPQFINTSGQNTLFNTTAGQQTQAQGINFLQNIASLFSSLTQGGSASSRGKSSSFSLAGGGGGGATGGGGGI